MKRFRFLSILLAAALQIMPYCRTLFTSPAATSTFAIVFRWTVGATAALGAYDAVSGATTVIFTTPTNYSGTVGTYYSNYVALVNNGGDPGAFFVLTNKTAISPALSKNMTTTVCMPPGLTFKCYDLNDGGTPKPIYGAIYGTPTSAVTNHWIHLFAGYQSLTPAQTNIFLTFLPASAAVKPGITNHPVGVTNVAGSTVNFSVLAGGTQPLAYRWRRFTADLAGETNPSLTLVNVRLSQAGDYTVVITNSAGAVTSSPATLDVTLPVIPALTASSSPGTGFEFAFAAVVGLTNTIETNGAVSGGGWTAMTNVPPPTSSSIITIRDSMGGPARFYRLRVEP